MFELNDALRKAFAKAADEARRINHSYIDGTTMVLGIIEEGASAAAKILLATKVDLRELRRHAIKQVGGGNNFAFELPEVKAEMSESLLQSVTRAGEVAKALGLEQISAELMMMALVKGDGKVRDGLLQAGLNREQFELLNKQLNELVISARDGKTTASARGDAEEAAENANEQNVCAPNTNNGKRSNTPNLDKSGMDLTELAKQGKLSPVFGRQDDIARVIRVLGRKTKNNPVLLGEAGVGKTAIVEGIAQRIAAGDVPKRIRDKRLCVLDLTLLVAGCCGRGSFEERISSIIKEVKAAGNVVLFIDELHTLLGAGGAAGGIDASNAFKPALARGELSTIGATTLDEYRKHIENKDPALARRFRTVMIDPPSVADSILILQGLRQGYEDHHGVKISDEAIKESVELSDRYINDRFLPDKAIDLMDEAASKLAQEQDALTKPLLPGSSGQSAADKDKPDLPKSKAKAEDANARINLAKAETEPSESGKLDLTKAADEPVEEDTRPVVTGEHVAQIISSATKIPLSRLTADESQRLLTMEAEIGRRVVSQTDAISSLSKAIRRGRMGLKDPGRPLGSFIFLGPTGVGKTEVVRALQEFVCGSDRDLIRIDMSEYMEKHTVSLLIGAPPGYVGYDEGGKLTEAVRRRPYSVVLLDEIEKAHPDVYNVLLQIMDAGRLTDRQGRTVDFQNTIIVMTSNLGAEKITKSGSNNELKPDVIESVMQDVHHHFSPEFINRLDDIICFKRLNQEDVGKISELMLGKVRQRLEKHSITLKLDDSAKEFLLIVGFDAKFGARPMRRAIQKYVEDALADGLLSKSFVHGDKLVARQENGELFFVKDTAGTAVAPPAASDVSAVQAA